MQKSKIILSGFKTCVVKDGDEIHFSIDVNISDLGTNVYFEISDLEFFLVGKKFLSQNLKGEFFKT